jgi:PPOX class probable F420-dependent enzyme
VPTSTPLPADLAALADEMYVSFTTFRRNGVPVATPVWIARDGDSLVFTTSIESGKAKRLRASGDVTLRACDRVGTVPEGAVEALGRAELQTEGEGLESGIRAIVEKYKEAAARLIGSTGDRNATTRAVVRITGR